MALEEYKKKRSFKVTPEPHPSIKTQNKKKAPEFPIFVIQEHHASHLHWDFRLEHKGVLASWAVPKGVPKEIGEKRLAMKVEDHPFDYKDFEGVIPEGQYGAGTVSIWDKGHYEPLRWDDKVVEILAVGEKLNGRYSLVHSGGYSGGKENAWIMIKNKLKE